MTQNIGVFLARMQPVHKGHLQMVELACEECDRVVVILGSENKVDMLRNPFDITLRKAMLEASLPKRYRTKVEVYEIPDWSMESREDDCKIWGRYFYYNAVSRIGQKKFKLYYSDGVEILDKWFKDTEVEPYIEYRLCDRSHMFDGLSATKIRNAFVGNDVDYIKQYCPPIVADSFDYLRDYYLGVVDHPQDDFEME